MLRTIRGLALAASLTIPTACDTLGLGDEPRMAVSFAVAGQASASNVSASLLADSIIFGGHSLNLQNVDVTFSEVTLERVETSTADSDGDSDADSDSDGANNEKLRRNNVTIALPLQGGVITPINESLPTGLYEELELDVEHIRLRGSYDGQSFDVTVPVQAELEFDFDPPLNIASDADRLNVTVQFDPTLWLREADGALIDPRLLAQSAEARARFVNRIRAAIRAFEDSDRDADETDSDSDRDSDSSGSGRD